MSLGINDMKEAVLYCWAIGRTPHIIGLHGIGKSSLVYQLAEEQGYTVVEKRLGLMADAGDLLGLLVNYNTTDGKAAVKHMLLDWFANMKPNTIVFLDEVNRAQKDLLQAVFELINDKSINGVKMPENCHVIAASNPDNGDYQVLSFDDPAFLDRMVHLVLEPTEEEFFTFAKAQGMPHSVLGFLRENPRWLEEVGTDIKLDFIKPSRRSNISLGRLEALDIPESKQNVKDAIEKGIVGLSAMMARKQWLDSQTKLPSGKEIIGSYKDKVRDAVLKLVKDQRGDVLGAGMDDVIAELSIEANFAPGLETHNKMLNVHQFALDLPTELSFALCMKLSRMPHIFNLATEDDVYYFNDSDALVEKFADVTAIREKFDAEEKAKQETKE